MKSSVDYSKLLSLLENQKWPRTYLFKFILPFEAESLNQLKTLFDDDSKITHRVSSKSTYISVSARQKMHSAQAVIEIYKQAEEIKDIISL